MAYIDEVEFEGGTGIFEGTSHPHSIQSDQLAYPMCLGTSSLET